MLVCGTPLTGFGFFIVCDCVISLDFSFKKERLYPRSLRYCMSSLARNVKLSSSEDHMRRNRPEREDQGNGSFRIYVEGDRMIVEGIGVCLSV